MSFPLVNSADATLLSSVYQADSTTTSHINHVESLSFPPLFESDLLVHNMVTLCAQQMLPLLPLISSTYLKVKTIQSSAEKSLLLKDKHKSFPSHKKKTERQHKHSQYPKQSRSNSRWKSQTRFPIQQPRPRSYAHQTRQRYKPCERQ